MLLAGAVPAQTPFARVREERKIVIDGVEETWRLVWTARPKAECGLSDASLTCPCEVFAYGEAGPMDLVRLRKGLPPERISLAPLFGENFGSRTPVAIIQRWLPNRETDTYEAFRSGGHREAVMRRPTVRIMNFDDYDHDGRATEFYLQTESLPCGKSYGVVLGVSRTRPALHVFSTADSQPIYLQKRNWALLARATGPIEAPYWTCGDHGYPNELRVMLSWTPQGITGTTRAYSCPPGPRRLLSEAPLDAKLE